MAKAGTSLLKEFRQNVQFFVVGYHVFLAKIVEVFHDGRKIVVKVFLRFEDLANYIFLTLNCGEIKKCMGSMMHVGITIITERVEDGVLCMNKLLIVRGIAKIIDDFYKKQEVINIRNKDKSNEWTYVQVINKKCNVLGCHEPQHNKRRLKSTHRWKNAR